MTKKVGPSGVVIIALTSLVLVLSVGSAVAHYLGGQFSHSSGTSLNLGYTINGVWKSNALTAINSWNDTPTRVFLFSESISSSEVDYYLDSYADSWWGLTVHHPCFG